MQIKEEIVSTFTLTLTQDELDAIYVAMVTDGADNLNLEQESQDFTEIAAGIEGMISQYSTI